MRGTTSSSIAVSYATGPKYFASSDDPEQARDRSRHQSTRQPCAPWPDEHQLNAIIATAILDSLKDHPNHSIGPEEARIMAKRIIAALADAGLHVTIVDQS